MKVTEEQKAAILQAAAAYDEAVAPRDKRDALYDFNSITDPCIVVAILRELEEVKKELRMVVRLGFGPPLSDAEVEDKSR